MSILKNGKALPKKEAIIKNKKFGQEYGHRKETKIKFLIAWQRKEITMIFLA